MTVRLRGRVAAITGASSGIGEASAHVFAPIRFARRAGAEVT